MYLYPLLYLILCIVFELVKEKKIEEEEERNKEIRPTNTSIENDVLN